LERRLEMDIPLDVQVHCEDGLCGHSTEVVLDPETDEVTHLVMREGHLWGEKDVSIPVSEIDRIEETVIHLRLDKRGIEALSAIPIRRRSSTL
jgi:hypothetical protein